MKTVRVRILLSAAAAGIASAVVLAVPEPAAAIAASGKSTAVRASGRYEMQSRTGTLRTYRAGQSVVIAGADGRLKRLPVDPAAQVERGLVRGQQVNVISMTDESGRERVSAISRSAPAAAQTAAGNTPPNPRR